MLHHISEFLFQSWIIPIVSVYHILFNHSFIETSAFLPLAIVNSATINMGCKNLFKVPASVSFGYIARNGIAVSYGNSMFNYFENQYTIFHSSFTVLSVGQAAGDSRSSRLLPRPGYPVQGSSDNQAPVVMENGWRDKFPNPSAFEFRDPYGSSDNTADPPRLLEEGGQCLCRPWSLDPKLWNVSSWNFPEAEGRKPFFFLEVEKQTFSFAFVIIMKEGQETQGETVLQELCWAVFTCSPSWAGALMWASVYTSWLCGEVPGYHNVPVRNITKPRKYPLS